MRIGIFSDSYTPEINGVVTSIETFRHAFESMGHEVFIFAPSEHLTYDADPAARVWRFPSTRFFGDKQSRMVAPIPLFKFPDDVVLDVVHTQTPLALGLFGIRVARDRNIPLVHTYHTLYEEYAPHYLHVPRAFAKSPVRWVSKHFVEQHDGVVAPSSGMKRLLEEYGVTKRITVIPTGIDIEDIHRTARNGSGAPLAIREPFIMTASRLGKEKNVDFLLQSFVRAKKDMPSLSFVVCGDGVERERLMEAAKEAGVHESVVFTGFVSHETLFDLYTRATAFVFASHTETQGLAVLEAMALGVPVVALRGMGVEDIVADDRGGFLVEQEDPRLFADRIRAIITDTAVRTQKKEEAALRAHDFSIQKTTQKLLAFYKTCGV